MNLMLVENETQKKLTDAAEKAISLAKQQGATEVEISLSKEVGFSTTVRMGEIEKLIYNHDNSLDVTVYFGKRKGSASTTDVRDQALEETVKAACNIAKFTDEDPCAGLADKSLMATEFPDIDCFHPWQISPEKAIEMARLCEQSAMRQDKRLFNSDGAWLETHQGYYLMANSNDFMQVERSTHHSLGCGLIAKEKEEMQRDYDYTTALDYQDLASLETVARNAAKNTLSRLGSRRLPTQKAPVIFINHEAVGLISLFASAISGGNLYRKSSFLLDAVGKEIFPEFVHIHEMPFLPKGLASATFDDDGLACRTQDFVKNGVLERYMLGSYSARKLGLETTANAGGAHNLQINPHDIDFKGLVKEMDKGLIVTELMGQGVNLITGDYSRGAAGFWVEQGEIQFPVHEITIAGNLRQLFAGIQKVANDIDPRRSIRSGSILIDEMMIAGE